MTNSYGWAGQYLDIDLSSSSIKTAPLEDTMKKSFLGGRGLNAKFLFDSLEEGIDPCSPENILVIGTGPLTGTLGATGRFNVTSISPLTGFLADGNGGGHWASELKYAGYDHMIIRGKARELSYLYIDDERVSLLDGSHLKGKDVWETTQLLQQEHGDPNLQVAAIGLAGENLVRYACMIVSLSRTPGRCGTGAVMGSKNLKAIAVRGRRGVKVFSPIEYKKYFLSLYKKMLKSPAFQLYPRFGTSILVEGLQAHGLMPAKNFSHTAYPHEKEALSSQIFNDKYVVKARSCFGCPVHCDRYFHAQVKNQEDVQGPGIEYESIAAFGTQIGNLSYPLIFQCHNKCSKAGLDVVSTGNSIALAMDLFERGILTTSHTGGINIQWGDGETILNLIDAIIAREGIGDLLAEGPYHIGEKLGEEARERVVHMKRLDPTAVETRGYKGKALAFATSTRGADHLRGVPQTEVSNYKSYPPPEEAIKRFGSKEVIDPKAYDTVGKPKVVAWLQHLSALLDSLEICKFNTIYSKQPVDVPELSELLYYLSGVEISADDMYKAGERIFNLERCINLFLGLKQEDDFPCNRLFKEALPDGPCSGAMLEREPFAALLRAYYLHRGWDPKTGTPTKETLEALGLKEEGEKVYQALKASRKS